MEIPLQITVRDLSPSDAIEAHIRERAVRLERFHDRIVGCRVVVEAPHRHRHQGVLYHVRIDLTVPGGELVVKRESNEDAYVAVRDAFDAARRRLEDYARRQRGVLKTHGGLLLGRVSKLFPEEGYGFIETPDGREIYFHRNSVLNDGFDRLEIGREVRFSEEPGEQGPQASTVRLAGRNRVKMQSIRK